MTLEDAIKTLRPLARSHATEHGQRTGFLIEEAYRALGGMSEASSTMTALISKSMVNGEPVVIQGELTGLYWVGEKPSPQLA